MQTPPLVKLGATTSTNDFLKELSQNPATENFTVVTAESQSAGRGQMGTTWMSEEGKNLMFSVLVKDFASDASQLFTLNVAVALAVCEVVEKHDIESVSIKWPNDIMSADKKIGGILIENSFKPNGEIVSVVGIGLNVNQQDFSALPKAASLHTVSGRTFNRDELREGIVERIIRNVHFIAEHADVLWKAYHEKLFKVGVPAAFERADGHRFMGMIKSVTRDGKLELQLEDDSRKLFNIKEIQLLY
ncbi:putative biotin--[acetyl-CoA-carboxylase] ligase [Flavobacterium longum]|uniref:biotin--[acetyl-CoA-carboxylase] ligase n=1 Tax=Flavobacterium longum TaxID=1299340 RepID=UPI0039EC90C0